MTPTFSVVVATRDRPRDLERCLAALRTQQGPVLELIVVDDGSTDGDAVRREAERAGAMLVVQPPLGVAAARNSGAGRASTPYVAFVDDDSEPMPNWAALLMDRLAAGAVAVAGPVVANGAGGQLGLASQLAANCLIDRDAHTASRTVYGPGANLACRMDVLRSIPFDESYSGIGAEDRDWCARLAKHGVALTFEPAAKVWHNQKLTLAEFCRRQYRYGRGAQVYRARHEQSRLETPGFYAKVIADGFRVGPVVGLLVCVAQVATAAGYLRELLAGRSRRTSGASRRTESQAKNRAAS
ncbi:MAG: glycosyltransferase family A protein [Actinomycetota bacterium]